MPDIKVELLKKGNLDDIYFEAYIKKSTTLLYFEKEYQKGRRNNKAVRKCEAQERIIFEKIKAEEKELKQMQFKYSLRKERFKEKNDWGTNDDNEEMEPDFGVNDDEEKTSSSFKQVTDIEKSETRIWGDESNADKSEKDDYDPYRTL